MKEQLDKYHLWILIKSCSMTRHYAMKQLFLRYFMATSSIFANVKITDPRQTEDFADARCICYGTRKNAICTYNSTCDEYR